MDVLERHILDTLPLTVCTIDLEGRITSANRPSFHFLSADGSATGEDTLVGASLRNAIVDPEARDQVERAVDLLRTGHSQTVTWEFSGGSSPDELVFLMQLSPIHDGHTVSGYVFSSVDITSSHQSREALIDAGIALSRPIALDRALHELAHQIRRTVPYDAIAI